MRRVPVFVLALASVLAASVTPSPAQEESVAPSFQATLTSGNEVPPNASTATASVVITVFAPTNEVCQYQLVTGLTGPATAMHIHSGPAGANGPIEIGFTPGAASECVTADAGDVAGIIATPDQYYFNIHTGANPGGEIRGQLAAAPETLQYAILNGTLSGGAEVPPNSAPTAGSVQVVIDLDTNLVCATVLLRNQTMANITGMHIHQAPAGVNGGIVVPFAVAVDPCTLADPATVAAIMATPTDFYFNVHTAAYPGGEARAQLVLIAGPPGEAPGEPAPAEPVPAEPRFTG
jgi:Cu/Zn superoxide dismutase